jgi:hypothetical protein
MNNISFSRWLASRKAVSFALAIGVIFLVTNYQHIIFNSNPDSIGKFSYPFFVLVVLSHIDSFFFGITTAIMMFQARSEKIKILYCVMEAVMIFLNLNQPALKQVFTNPEILIRTYIAAFSGFSFYFLGSLMAKYHAKAEKIQNDIDVVTEEIAKSVRASNGKK